MEDRAGPNFQNITPQLCINAKVRKLHRILNNVYQARINPLGLRGSMLSILFIIGKNKGVNQKQIAEMLVLDQSTVSRDIKKLAKKGWVNISKGDDTRATKLSISTSGFELLEEVSPIWEKTHKQMEALLGEHNINQINNLIAAVSAKDKL